MDEQTLRKLRADFPILNQRLDGNPFIYFDNAATTQKPRSVIDSQTNFYRRKNANVHRSAHQLAEWATNQYEQSRSSLAAYLGVSAREIVWTSGATEALNLVAMSYLVPRLKADDRVLVVQSNHHANILPWQQACELKSAKLDVVQLNEDGSIDLDQYQQLLEPEPRLVAFSHVSNLLGSRSPIKEMTRLAKQASAMVVIDGAQALPHFRVNLTDLNADFYCFSGHKIFGPTGIGALWARYDLLEAMSVWKTGGEMIESVSFEQSSFAPPPQKFEAGTPNIAGVLGLGAAINYLTEQDWPALEAHENKLATRLSQGLESIPGIHVLPSSADAICLRSFYHPKVHSQDIATGLDQAGIAVRAGHHCAEPMLRSLGLDSVVRASLCFYNTESEIDRFLETVDQLTKPLSLGATKEVADCYRRLLAASSSAERYNLLLELGRQIGPSRAGLREPAWEVKGCESRVWMRILKTDNGQITLETDADAKFLRGLLYLIERWTEKESLSLDSLDELQSWLSNLGFERYLSRSRGNAVRTLLSKIETLLSDDAPN